MPVGPGGLPVDAVVAKDGTGNFTTVSAAVEAESACRYVMYVKRQVYRETVEVKKWNLIRVGDGIGAAVITGRLNYVDGYTPYRSATVGELSSRALLLCSLALVRTVRSVPSSLIGQFSRSLGRSVLSSNELMLSLEARPKRGVWSGNIAAPAAPAKTAQKRRGPGASFLFSLYLTFSDVHVVRCGACFSLSAASWAPQTRTRLEVEGGAQPVMGGGRSSTGDEEGGADGASSNLGSEVGAPYRTGISPALSLIHLR
jgi:hypothetical protein